MKETQLVIHNFTLPSGAGALAGAGAGPGEGAWNPFEALAITNGGANSQHPSPVNARSHNSENT